MANISTFSNPFDSSTARANPARRPSVLRRIVDAIMESRQRKADAEIAEFLHRRDRRGF